VTVRLSVGRRAGSCACVEMEHPPRGGRRSGGQLDHVTAAAAMSQMTYGRKDECPAFRCDIRRLFSPCQRGTLRALAQASNPQIAAHPSLSPADLAVTRDQARVVFGQVMGLVALTLGFLALGAYIGRDLSGGWGILAFVASFGCVIGLNVASARGIEQLSITLLFCLGLLLGLALGPVLSSYVEADPAAVWQAAGATGAFVASLGAVGYATRRDLSSWYRALFWALLGLILFGLAAVFVSIPNENIIWSVAGS
jgi:FtsH-binding integral membrane protein